MIFQKLQFSLYEFLIRYKIVPILMIVAISTWSYFSISFHMRFTHFESSYFSICMTRYMAAHPTTQANQLLLSNSILEILPTYSGFQQACQISQLQPNWQSEPQQVHLFRDLSLEYLPSEAKFKHKISQVRMIVNMNSLAEQMVYEYFGTYQILISRIAKFIEQEDIRGVYVRDFNRGRETVEIKNANYKSFVKFFVFRIIAFVAVILKVYLCSLFAGIVMISSIICLVRTLTLFGEIFFRVTGNNIIHRYVPFMSQYLESLRAGRKQYVIKYVVIAYFAVSFIILYGIVYFIDTLLKSSLIGAFYTPGNDIGFMQIVMIEFLSLIVLRTRTSIKYSPTIILRILMITHFLAQISPYKLPLFYISLGFQISIIYLLVILITVESPIFNSRYVINKPSKQHPRALYFPNYNIAWHSIIPPLWTYFVPPHARGFFNSNQLSYVDGQYQRLYCILMGLPFESEEAERIVQEEENQQERRRRRPENEIQMANDLL